MTTKLNTEPAAPAPTLAALRAALDAPAREAAAEAARAQELARRQSQGALAAYARGIVAKAERAAAAEAAWNAKPRVLTEVVATFGERTPIWQADTDVGEGFRSIADAARKGREAAQRAAELEGPALLPEARLAQIRKELDAAAGHIEALGGIYAGWIAVRRARVVLLPAVRALLDACEARWTPTEAELALLAQRQEPRAAAAPAVPTPPPTVPPRGVSGAKLDGLPSAVRETPSPRAPAGIENLRGV